MHFPVILSSTLFSFIERVLFIFSFIGIFPVIFFSIASSIVFSLIIFISVIFSFIGISFILTFSIVLSFIVLSFINLPLIEFSFNKYFSAGLSWILISFIGIFINELSINELISFVILFAEISIFCLFSYIFLFIIFIVSFDWDMLFSEMDFSYDWSLLDFNFIVSLPAFLSFIFVSLKEYLLLCIELFDSILFWFDKSFLIKDLSIDRFIFIISSFDSISCSLVKSLLLLNFSDLVDIPLTTVSLLFNGFLEIFNELYEFLSTNIFKFSIESFKFLFNIFLLINLLSLISSFLFKWLFFNVWFSVLL